LVKKRAIRASFQQKIAQLDLPKSTQYRLHFRAWESDDEALANALTLPSGDIILTDALVEIATNLDEINAILLHEVGHVVYRHGLQSLIRGTFIASATVLILGDSSAVVDFGLGLGAALAESQFSKIHETQADLYAFKKMLLLKIDPQSFSKIMKNIETVNTDETQENETSSSYFSSHPSTDKRVEIAQKYSLCFHKQQTICHF
jgi:Zn-dependent protease with chaperone function